MFGKRTSDAAAPRRVVPQPSAAAGSAAVSAGAQACRPSERRVTPAPAARAATPALRRILRRQDDGLQRADRHHRSDAARQARRRLRRAKRSATSSARSSRSRTSSCPSPSRRSCSRTSATTCSATDRSSRCWRATTSPTSWSTAPTRRTSKSPARCRRPACASPTTMQLMNICQRIVSQVGRRVDESSPICDARLPDGSRVNVIAPPLAIDGPVLTIRKFKRDRLDLEQLAKLRHHHRTRPRRSSRSSAACAATC